MFYTSRAEIWDWATLFNCLWCTFGFIRALALSIFAWAMSHEIKRYIESIDMFKTGLHSSRIRCTLTLTLKGTGSRSSASVCDNIGLAFWPFRIPFSAKKTFLSPLSRCGHCTASAPRGSGPGRTPGGGRHGGRWQLPIGGHASPACSRLTANWS